MGPDKHENGKEEAIPLTSYSHSAMLDLNTTDATTTGSKRLEDGDDEAIPSTSYSDNAMLDFNQTSAPWESGFWRRRPNLAIFALVLTFISTIGTIIIVKKADGDSIHSWKIKSWNVEPAVFLSVCYSVANYGLIVALGEAGRVAWWTTALRDHTTVRDMHDTWTFSHSVWDIILGLRSWRGPKMIALITLLVSIVPLNGPLFQKVLVVEEDDYYYFDYEDQYVTIRMAQFFPAGFTGLAWSNSTEPVALGKKFSWVVREHYSNKEIESGIYGCDGRCTGRVRGAGYAINCTNSTEVWEPRDVSVNESFISPVFHSTFSYEEEEGGNINFTSAVISDCKDGYVLSWNNCTLRPATMKYPFVITNDTIWLDPLLRTLMDEDDIISYHNVIPRSSQGSAARFQNTTHGGMYLVLKARFDTRINFEFIPPGHPNRTERFDTSDYQMKFRNEGSAGALEYLLTEYSGDCDDSWNWITVDMKKFVTELSFHAALYVASEFMDYLDDTVNGSSLLELNEDNYKTLPQRDTLEYKQSILASKRVNRVVYRAKKQYLWPAFVLTLVTNLLVIIPLWGWWSLGRDVSLSPIETARAFAAPLLANSTDPNAPVEDLLKQAGNIRISYGAVYAAGADSSTSRGTLRFDEAERCQRPHDGQQFDR